MKTVALTEIKPALLTIADAARYLAMGESAFRALHRNGDIEYVYLNSKPCVRVADLDALIAAAPTERAS